MQTLIKSLLLATALVSCGTNKDSRYRDISKLERPPTLPSNPTYTTDDSSIEKQPEKLGLGDIVYLTTEPPLQLRIKLPINKAWYALAQAIKQNRDTLTLTDHDRDKTIYYISTTAESDSILSFLSSDTTINYAISAKGSGNETAVMINIAAEQSGASSNPDGVDTGANANPDKILHLLYETLREDLNLDYNGS
ncbi:MAG: hypothetical protein EXR80_04760 [Methylococcales bacterium]|nr:hypothetical protein [Methylococcales bacterium]